MRVGNFSVLIPQGRELDSGHVSMAHGTVYTIRMQNHFHRSCDAEVKVDGKEVGAFRLSARGGELTLERSADDTGCFTFYQADSSEGQAVGSGISKDERGLIQVTFRPEKCFKPPVPTVRHMGACGQSVGGHEEKTSGGIKGLTRGMSFHGDDAPAIGAAGVTGLTGKSDQTFRHVPPLDYDLNEVVTITLRLVVGQNSPRVLQPVQRGNPVPAPVE